MIASGEQVVHQMAKGISKRIVGGPVGIRWPPAVLLKEPLGCVESDLSREAGGWYRPILKPCMMAGWRFARWRVGGVVMSWVL